MANNTIFFSYSRNDSEFVINLAKIFRDAGANIWMDQLELRPGTLWDSSIESALKSSQTLLVVLSKSSVKSNNVLDEVSYALEENKKVVPILLEDCDIPFRLKRLQYVSFKEGDKKGLESLVNALDLDDATEKKIASLHNIILRAKNDDPKPKPPGKDDNILNKKGEYKKPDKSNKSLIYVLSGLLMLVVLIFVLVLTADVDSYKEDPYIPENPNQNQNELLQTSKTLTNSETEIAQDWAQATNNNSIEDYIQFAQKYGKNNVYYTDAFTRMKNMFTENGYVKYGILNEEQYFNKTLYFDGNELSIPEQGDFISPKMTNEIWKNNYPTGYYVQPGRFYLVLGVNTDSNNEVWVHLAI